MAPRKVRSRAAPGNSQVLRGLLVCHDTIGRRDDYVVAVAKRRTHVHALLAPHGAIGADVCRGPRWLREASRDHRGGGSRAHRRVGDDRRRVDDRRHRIVDRHGRCQSGAQAPSTAAPSTAAPSARPEPKQFVAIDQLKAIHFDFDKYDIRAGDAKILDTNAGWLKSNPDQLVLIEGHCDERGTNEYNLALGERRAKSTMNYLVSQGVQASRITIISYGEERPLCTQKTEECWSSNRRAHFLVKPR
jgi:peptidoglycan-associated lipoprotein